MKARRWDKEPGLEERMNEERIRLVRSSRPTF